MTTWDSIYEEFTKILEHQRQLSIVFGMLLKLPHNGKVLFLYKLLRDYNLLPRITQCTGKSGAAAMTYRNLGNNSFGNKRDYDALKYYTKSIAYAPIGSKDLALAYGNRSAVLFALRRYMSSLIDLNRALNLPYPENLKRKLLNRKKQCMEQMKAMNNDAKKVLNSLSELSSDDAYLQRCMENAYKNCQLLDEDSNDANYDSKFALPLAGLSNELHINSSKRVKIEFTETLGRYLVATENINPGEIVVVDMPFATTLLPDFFHTHCSNCYMRCEMLIPCEGCSVVMFCSSECREEAADLFHRVECKMIESILSLELNRTALLSIRTFLVATKQGKALKDLMVHPIYGKPFRRSPFNPENVYDPTDYSSVHDLIDNFEKKEENYQLYRCCTAAAVLHILKEFKFFADIISGDESVELLQKPHGDLHDMETFAGTLLLKYIYISEANSHEISEVIEQKAEAPKREMTLGAGLYPMISMANHSCNPNMVRFCHKNVMVFYALTPVMAGEQLADNYGFHFSTSNLQARQKNFQKYLFTCKCDACKFDWPLYEELPITLPEYLSEQVDKQQVQQFSKQFNEWLQNPMTPTIMDDYKFLCDYLILLHKCVKVPWKEHLECQEALRQMISTRANYYTYYNDLIV